MRVMSQASARHPTCRALTRGSRLSTTAPPCIARAHAACLGCSRCPPAYGNRHPRLRLGFARGPPGLTNRWPEYTSAILLAAGALEVDRLVWELYRRSSGRHVLPRGSQRLDGGDKAKQVLQELITSEGFYLPAAITYSGILPIEGNLSEARGYF